MKALPALIGLILGLVASSSPAQESGAGPAPEMKALVPWTGKWKLTETVSPSPFGKAGTAAYRAETRMVHGGVAMEARGKGKGPDGPLTWTETVYFDRSAGTFRNLYVDSAGMVGASPQEVSGSTIRGEWKGEAAGKKYTCRAASSLAPDGRSYTYEWTYSEDGANWKSWLNGKAVKVGSVK